MLNHEVQAERALLVQVSFWGDETYNKASFEEHLQELQRLVLSAQVEIAGVITSSRHQADTSYFVGTGKAEEIAEAVAALEVDVVIFNHSLSPSQERNLSNLCACRVLDRTDLILDIFAQRARTYEGKLQVELAQLKHKSTRLVRGRLDLQSQRGGVGMRGPGEMQLETDRRLIRQRMAHLNERLKKVAAQREQGRRQRHRAGTASVALVGYTNAGKSSLFNKLTNAKVYAADKLFATLDPTVRRLHVGDIGELVLADTVGFVRQLPHDLVAAFKATLTETREADLLLHVVDAADARIIENKQAVNDVLEEIDAAQVPQLVIYNKIDLCPELAPRIEYNSEGKAAAVWVSAHTGQGLPLIFEALAQLLAPKMVTKHLRLPPTEGKLRGKLYDLHSVQQESAQNNGDMLLSVRMPVVTWQQLKKQEGHKLTEFIEESSEFV